MASAGYSATILIDKLGIRPGMKVLLVNMPENYFELLGAGSGHSIDISDQLCKQKEIPDLVHLFVTNNKAFEKEMGKLKEVCKQNSGITIWVSWYKKAAKIPTDITEDSIRNYALRNGLVDVKVCAVSDTWSGLKLVVPLSKR